VTIIIVNHSCINGPTVILILSPVWSGLLHRCAEAARDQWNPPR
jgi:hypothetical protein